MTFTLYSAGLCLLELRDPGNLKNKTKISCFSFIGTREMRSHVEGNVTLTYKVTCESCSVCLCEVEFQDPINLKNKQKMDVLASLESKKVKGPF